MGRKWLVHKTKAEVQDDMWKIVWRFGKKETVYPRRVQGGGGKSKFNFEFTLKETPLHSWNERAFSGHALENVTKFVEELGYRLDMWHIVAGYNSLTLRLFLEAIEPGETVEEFGKKLGQVIKEL